MLFNTIDFIDVDLVLYKKREPKDPILPSSVSLSVLIHIISIKYLENWAFKQKLF